MHEPSSMRSHPCHWRTHISSLPKQPGLRMLTATVLTKAWPWDGPRYHRSTKEETESREEVGERGRQRHLVGLRLEYPKQPKSEQTKGNVSKSPRNLSVSWQSGDEGKDSELEFCIEKPSLGVENRHGKTRGRQRFLDLMVNKYRFWVWKKRRRGVGRERMQIALILCDTPLPRARAPPRRFRPLNSWSPRKESCWGGCGCRAWLRSPWNRPDWGREKTPQQAPTPTERTVPAAMASLPDYSPRSWSQKGMCSPLGFFCRVICHNCKRRNTLSRRIGSLFGARVLSLFGAIRSHGQKMAL